MPRIIMRCASSLLVIFIVIVENFSSFSISYTGGRIKHRIDMHTTDIIEVKLQQKLYRIQHVKYLKLNNKKNKTLEQTFLFSILLS